MPSNRPPFRLMPYILVALLGTIFGLFWAYVIVPAGFVGGNPHRLNDASQKQWIRMVAVGYDPDAVYSNAAVIALLSQVNDPTTHINELFVSGTLSPIDQQALQRIRTLAQQTSGTPSPPAPTLTEQVFFSLIPLVLVIGLGLLVGLWVQRAR